MAPFEFSSSSRSQTTRASAARTAPSPTEARRAARSAAVVAARASVAAARASAHAAVMADSNAIAEATFTARAPSLTSFFASRMEDASFLPSLGPTFRLGVATSSRRSPRVANDAPARRLRSRGPPSSLSEMPPQSRYRVAHMSVGGPAPPRRVASVRRPSLSPRRQPTRAAAVAARAAFAPSSTKRRAEQSASSPVKKRRTVSSGRKPPPNAKTDEDEPKGEKVPDLKCCICLDQVERSDASRIDGCDHGFCFDCIAKWSEHENTCPLCKSRFKKIDRMFPQPKRKKGFPNSKRVKQRDQRSDNLAGSAFEGILQQLLSNHPGGGRFFMSRLVPAGPRFRDGPPDDVHELMSVLFRAPARSYAANSTDRSAGRARENPLEIDDSDSDVEVVEVTRP